LNSYNELSFNNKSCVTVELISGAFPPDGNERERSLMASYIAPYKLIHQYLIL